MRHAALRRLPPLFLPRSALRDRFEVLARRHAAVGAARAAAEVDAAGYWRLEAPGALTDTLLALLVAGAVAVDGLKPQVRATEPAAGGGHVAGAAAAGAAHD